MAGDGASEQHRLRDPLHAGKLPRAVGEAFDRRRFADVALYPAGQVVLVDGGGERLVFDDGAANVVRCNASALAAVSPFFRRILAGVAGGGADVCMTLECSSAALRQLAHFVAHGQTGLMDRATEGEFRQWAQVLEIRAVMNRTPLDRPLVQDLASDGNGEVQDDLSEPFICSFCCGVRILNLQSAIDHLENHKAQLDDKTFYQSLPTSGICLQMDYSCPVCAEVPVNENCTMDGEAIRKCFEHNRECKAKIETMQEDLKAKARRLSQPQVEGESGENNNEDANGDSCDKCGKVLRTNIARKKHAEKCGQGMGNVSIASSITSIASSIISGVKAAPSSAGPSQATSSKAASETKKSKVRREIKCQSCEEAFPTREALRLHTCDDGERSKIDQEGILDERTARKVRPEVGALKEPEPEKTGRKRRRKISEDSGSSGGGPVNPKVPSRSGDIASVDRHGEGGSSRVTESSLLSQVQQFRQEHHNSFKGHIKKVRRRSPSGSTSTNSHDEDAGARNGRLGQSDGGQTRGKSREGSPASSEASKGGDDDQTRPNKLTVDRADLSPESSEDEEDEPPPRLSPEPPKPPPKPGKAKRGRRGPFGPASRSSSKSSSTPRQRTDSESSRAETVEDVANFVRAHAAATSTPRPSSAAARSDSASTGVSMASSAGSSTVALGMLQCEECKQEFRGNSALLAHGEATGHKIAGGDDDDDDW